MTAERFAELRERAERIADGTCPVTISEQASWLTESLDEIKRLRGIISDAADDLTWTTGLYEAGDAEVIASLPDSLWSIQSELSGALDGEAVPDA